MTKRFERRSAKAGEEGDGVTMVMCDDDACRFNNDRVCANKKIYCVRRKCVNRRSANSCRETMKNHPEGSERPKMRDWNPKKGR